MFEQPKISFRTVKQNKTLSEFGSEKETQAK